MWLNRGLFRDNGGCGYVLKPAALFTKGYNPYVYDSYKSAANPMTLTVRVCIV